MLGRRLVPALLLVVSAAAALSASTNTVRATEECRLEPGLAAPPGNKWLFRINRDHRRCWFLSSKAAGHHPQRPHAATVREALRQGQQRDSDLQTASALKDKTDITVTFASQAVPQVAASSVKQSTENLLPHSVPTIAYSLSPASAQMVSGPTAVAVRVAQQTPADASESNMVLLAGAAAGLLFAGGIFHFTRCGRLPSRKHVVADQAVVRSLGPAKPPPMTTVLVEDLARKLRELKRDRPGPRGAYKLSRSHRA